MKLAIEKLNYLQACQGGKDWFLASGCKTVQDSARNLMREGLLEKDKVKSKTLLGYSSWILSKSLNKDGKILYAIFAARLVLEIFEKKHPDDNRPRQAIEAAENCLNDPSIINKNLCRDAAAAADAAYAAAAAADAAYAAAYAAYAAAAAADAYAAAAAAYDAADDAYAAAAAAAAAYAAYAAADDAYAAADARKEIMKKILTYGIKLICEMKE